MPDMLLIVLLAAGFALFFIGRYSGLNEGYKYGRRKTTLEFTSFLYRLPPDVRKQVLEAAKLEDNDKAPHNII